MNAVDCCGVPCQTEQRLHLKKRGQSRAAGVSAPRRAQDELLRSSSSMRDATRWARSSW